MIRAVSSPVASQFGPGAWPLSVITPIAAVPPEPRRPLYEHRRLLAAVLQQAIEDAAEATEDGERARDWFASDAVHDPFAFAAICDVLDLDAGRIRKLIASRVPARLHQASLLDVPPREPHSARGCIACGWASVDDEDLCSDPALHNPSCVRRGDSRPRSRRTCRLCGSRVDGIRKVSRESMIRALGVSQLMLCPNCQVRTNGNKSRARAQHSAITAALGWQPRRLRDIATALGWTLPHALHWMRRMIAAGEVERVGVGLYRRVEVQP